MSNQEQPFASDPNNSEEFGEVFGQAGSGAGEPGFGDMGQGDMLEAETAERAYGGSSNSVQKRSILLMVVCVLGVGGIYFFGQKDKGEDVPLIDEETEAKVDVALAKLARNSSTSGKSLLKDSEAMVNSFYQYSVKQQVKLDELNRDPFNREKKKTGPVVESDDVKQAKLRRQLNEKLESIKLQSILQGPTGGKCMANGEVYGVGQVIGQLFTVKSIDESMVVLEAKGMTFKLVL